jgi:hypothetical protein
MASADAINTQPVEGSPYDTFSITRNDDRTSSSAPPAIARGTHMPKSPSR